MATMTEIANLKGPTGKTGPRGLQGLPGVNGVENDEAMATNVATPTATRDALLKLTDRHGVPTNQRFLYALNPAWTDAVKAVRAGTRDAKVMCIGDSTTHGTGSSAPRGFLQETAWPSFLAQNLNQYVARSSYGMGIPISNSASNPIDSRWTLGSGWTQTTNVGVGVGGRCSAWQGVVGSGALKYNDPMPIASHFDIYYVTNTTSSLGQFTAQATGGSPVVVECGSQPAKGIEKVTVAAGSTSQSNVVSITNTGSSGSVYIVGIEPFWQGQTRIRVGNFGVAGSTTTQWLARAAGDTTDAWNVFGMITAYEPDLTIVDLGINDAAAPLSADQFMTNITKITDAAANAGSAVLLKTMIPSKDSSGRVDAEKDYRTKLLAANAPLIDSFGYYETWDASDALGMMFDSLHGNDLMYADEGAYIAGSLAAVTGF